MRPSRITINSRPLTHESAPVARDNTKSKISILFARAWILSLLLVVSLPASAKASESAAGFSHALWAQLLSEVVDPQGLVDYEAVRKDSTSLEAYVASIARESPRSHPESFPTPDSELAYYINAYNALVFQGVIDRPASLDSVWGKTQSGYGFFVKQKVVVGGQTTNLRKLENEIIRAQYKDPRIHAALNCASVGCPRLPREIFDPSHLDKQLDQAMREFVSTEAHCSYDSTSHSVVLSKIFDWFREDFEDPSSPAGATTLLGYINHYREPGAQIPSTARVAFRPYDKQLNRQ